MFHSGMRYPRKKKGPRKSIDTMTYRELLPILDTEYSLFRRMSAADRHIGSVRCVTCNTPKHWKDIDLGHYITRAIHAVRYDDQNTAPQCKKCNRFMNGMPHEFRAYLVRMYGEQGVQELEVRAGMGNGWTAELLREKIRFYREKNALLKKEFQGL